MGAVGEWELSVLSPGFCCELETDLKKLSTLKKKSYETTGNLDIVEVTLPEAPQLESDGAEGRADTESLSHSKASSFV